jgi:8-oxo-dGTP pyrophosphatase MutT (NUDIX family)
VSKHREIACAVVIDLSGQFLLQQSDNVPGILYPGKVSLFGGHREGDETFLECVARELHEELSHFIPQERFEPLFSYEGPDWDQSGATLHGEFFIVRDIPIDAVTVTEGTLLVVSGIAAFDSLQEKLAPSAAHALRAYAEKHTVTVSKVD